MIGDIFFLSNTLLISFSLHIETFSAHYFLKFHTD